MRGKRAADCDIELGLAISALSLKYGQTRSIKELAAFCGCSKSNIQYIEERALSKLRRAIFMRNDPEMKELVDHIIQK